MVGKTVAIILISLALIGCAILAIFTISQFLEMQFQNWPRLALAVCFGIVSLHALCGTISYGIKNPRPWVKFSLLINKSGYLRRCPICGRNDTVRGVMSCLLGSKKLGEVWCVACSSVFLMKRRGFKRGFEVVDSSVFVGQQKESERNEK